VYKTQTRAHASDTDDDRVPSIIIVNICIYAFWTPHAISYTYNAFHCTTVDNIVLYRIQNSIIHRGRRGVVRRCQRHSGTMKSGERGACVHIIITFVVKSCRNFFQFNFDLTQYYIHVGQRRPTKLTRTSDVRWNSSNEQGVPNPRRIPWALVHNYFLLTISFVVLPVFLVIARLSYADTALGLAFLLLSPHPYEYQIYGTLTGDVRYQCSIHPRGVIYVYLP